jgi:nucleotide-binding universal stress UspA family protein
VEDDMHVNVQTVLAATDLSRPAFAAVRRAALIARAHGASLELLHVISESMRSAAWQEFRAAFAPMEADIRAGVAESLDALVAQIESETGVRARPVTVDGKPFAEIAVRSEAINADVIVVGAHGEHLLTPFLGTTAHRVLRYARKPVLLIKYTPQLEHATTSEYKHIVVATDFSEDSREAARSARRLYPQSSITLLHVFQAPFEGKLAGRISDEALMQHRQRAMERAHRELESFANVVELSDAPRVVRHGFPATRIREYATDTSVDLIAIGSEEVPRLQNALLGSVSLDIVTQASCDVLLARTSA